MATGDLRRYRKADASRVLFELGAPRSVHTLKKDHSKQPGESGPKFVRDSRGVVWYWHASLSEYAAQQRAQLSPDNPSPAPFFDPRAAHAIRHAKQNRLLTVVGADSSSSEKPGKNKPTLPRAAIGGGRSVRSKSGEGQ